MSNLLIKVFGFLVMALVFLSAIPVFILVFALVLIDKASEHYFKLENKGG